MYEEYKKKAKEKMDNNLTAFKARLRKMRDGRAAPALLEGVTVVYYGNSTPLARLANISSPEPRTLVITPFDGQILKDMEQALVKANLGVTPQNNGKVLRLVMPELTEERRQALVREVKKEAEKCRVDLRMSRRTVNDEIKNLVKDKILSEDEQKRLSNEIQKITDSRNREIDELFKIKEKEILEV